MRSSGDPCSERGRGDGVMLDGRIVGFMANQYSWRQSMDYSAILSHRHVVPKKLSLTAAQVEMPRFTRSCQCCHGPIKPAHKKTEDVCPPFR